MYTTMLLSQQSILSILSVVSLSLSLIILQGSICAAVKNSRRFSFLMDIYH